MVTGRGLPANAASPLFLSPRSGTRDLRTATSTLLLTSRPRLDTAKCQPSDTYPFPSEQRMPTTRTALARQSKFTSWYLYPESSTPAATAPFLDSLASYAALDRAARAGLQLPPHTHDVPAMQMARDLAHTIAYLMVRLPYYGRGSCLARANDRAGAVPAGMQGLAARRRASLNRCPTSRA